MLLHFPIFFYRTYALQKWKKKKGEELLSMQIISPDTLEKRCIIQWPEVNKRPYWFMCECKKKGVIKASPYAEC